MDLLAAILEQRNRQEKLSVMIEQIQEEIIFFRDNDGKNISLYYENLMLDLSAQMALSKLAVEKLRDAMKELEILNGDIDEKLSKAYDNVDASRRLYLRGDSELEIVSRLKLAA